MKKLLKTIGFILFAITLAPVIYIAGVIHESYKYWYFKQTLKRVAKPVSFEEANKEADNRDE